MAGGAFPRGWILNSTTNTVGQTASLTTPGLTGVVRVLDSLYLRINSNGAAAFGVGATLTTAAGVILSLFLSTPATTQATDEISLSGLDIATSPGGSITIQYTAAVISGIAEIIVAQGHDI